MYLNAEFRDRVLRDIYNARGHRAAPSYGYDLIQVLRYAWRAWWLDLTPTLAALGVVTYALCVNPMAALLAADALALCYVGQIVARGFLDAIMLVYRWTSYDNRKRVQYQLRWALFWLLAAALLTLLTVLLARRGRRGWPVHEAFVPAGALILTMCVPFVVVGLLEGIELHRLRLPDALRPRRLRNARLRILDWQQRQWFVVYSGYRPFVGSGYEMRWWSFAQRLVKPKALTSDWDEEHADIPFGVTDLVDMLKESFDELASTMEPQTRLPGLLVHDHVFVDGMHVAEVKEALARDPGPEVFQEILENPRETARYHIACQVVSWDGELVTTVFTYISLQGNTLYVEFSTYALPPTPIAFRIIDEVGGTGPAAALKRSARKALEAFTLVRGPLKVGPAAILLWGALKAQRKVSDKAAMKRDIGARLSAREIATRIVPDPPDSSFVTGLRASPREKRTVSYFQSRDFWRHSKILERRLLATIEKFLNENGVDTSEFRQRATTILNSGVLNTGSGTVSIQDSAVGSNATVVTDGAVS